MTRLHVVGRRVDALTLAYRVRLDEELVALLEARACVAREHGRASFTFRGLVGELAHSRATRTWHVTAERAGWRVMVDMKAAGGIDLPNGERLPGWTIEVVWYAQALANLADVGEAVERTRRMVESLGAVYDARVRRIDLAADVAGAVVVPGDVDRLVRRSRAKVVSHGIDAPLLGGSAHHAPKRQISGISVCPGGALMARLYDKRRELANQPDGKRLAEESRWRDGGWDGETPVLRVEFQIRGTAIKELGIRDPDAPRDAATGLLFEGQKLRDRLDPIWAKCLEWARLVRVGVPKPGKRFAHADRLSDCADDPLWTTLRAVRFVVEGRVMAATRKRIRGGVSAAQAMGSVLSILGWRDKLERLPVFEGEPIGATRDFEIRLESEVITMFARAGAIVASDLLDRWGVKKAMPHVSEINNAVIARLQEARAWEARAGACA